MTQIIDNDYIHKVDITQFNIIQIVGKSSSFLVRPEKEEVKIKGKQYTTKICILLKEVDKQTIENYEEEIRDSKRIEVDKRNKYFLSEEGILFNKRKTQLIAAPEKSEIESYIVPKSVKK